jgi:hypothetical protein
MKRIINLEPETKNSRTLRPQIRFVFLGVLCLVTIFSTAQLSSATGTITKSDLTGPWQITLIHGLSGCGVATDLVDVTLNSSGSGTATVKSHTQGCGDSTTSQTFTIISLSSNGSGTASLSCGTGCGFGFNIQVAPDRSMFNLVDVDPTNPGNFVEGVAIHQ